MLLLPWFYKPLKKVTGIIDDINQNSALWTESYLCSKETNLVELIAAFGSSTIKKVHCSSLRFFCLFFSKTRMAWDEPVWLAATVLLE